MFRIAAKKPLAIRFGQMYSKCSVPHLVNTPPLGTSIEFFHIPHAVSSMHMRAVSRNSSGDAFKLIPLLLMTQVLSTVLAN